MPTRTTLAIALRALRRNALQTSLTITGMTIGVAAVLTMIAIGTGAETAIEDQIRAAGMNLIVVTAGNYKVKSTDDFGGSAVEPSAALQTARRAGRCAPRSGIRGVRRRFRARASIPKTTRWRSTTIPPRSSASATARPGSAPPRR